MIWPLAIERFGSRASARSRAALDFWKLASPPPPYWESGEAAMIQRCPVHKRRNVIDHLPEQYKSADKKKLQTAYAMTEYADAKRALERLHRELMELNPSAARSLEEGMEETL